MLRCYHKPKILGVLVSDIPCYYVKKYEVCRYINKPNQSFSQIWSQPPVHLIFLITTMRTSFLCQDRDRLRPWEKNCNLENLLLVCTAAYFILVPLIFWFQSKIALNAQAHLAVSYYNYLQASIRPFLVSQIIRQCFVIIPSFTAEILLYVRLGSQLRFCTKTWIYGNEWQYYSAKRAKGWRLDVAFPPLIGWRQKVTQGSYDVFKQTLGE